MKRLTGATALLAGVLAACPAAFGGEGAGASGDRKGGSIEEILAELEAQRAEIETLRLRLAVQEGRDGKADSGVEEAVRKYLESEEGRKLLGKDGSDFRVSWKDGLSFETADKAFTLKIGGRLHYDFVFPDADEEVEAAKGDFDPRSGFRRARIEMWGTIHESVVYKLGVEFAGDQGITDEAGGTSTRVGSYIFKDSYVAYRGIPYLGTFQVGYPKEPVGLEEMTSDNFITFIERSLPINAFAPLESPGFQFVNSVADDRIHWAAGDFWDSASGGTGNSQIQHSITARIAGNPVRNLEERTLIHVGASWQSRSPESETDRVRVRPTAAFVPRTQDTGTLSVDSEEILGLEFAAVRRNLSMQAEWFSANVEGHPDVAGAPNPRFTGWYAMGSWFVTGESRTYKGGAFGRVKPESNFKGRSGTGALELAARYSALDLDDDGVAGGAAHDWTFGANWHLNPNARVMLNYVLYTLHHVGDVNSVTIRLQVDF